MKRKILALALAVLMLVSVLPTSVFAADAHEHAECKGEKHTLATCPDANQIGEPVAPACGKEGYTLFECPDCGDFFADNFLPKLGEHVPGKVVKAAKPAYCGVPGWEATYECKNCGEEFGGETIKALPGEHNYVVDEDRSTSVSCETAGKRYLRCTICDHVHLITTEATGHSWSKHPIIDVEPTVGAAGSAHYECTAEGCTATYGPIEIKPVCSHKLEVHEIQWPKCGVEGVEAYSYCSFCDVYYNEEGLVVEYEDLIIPAGEHAPKAKAEPIEVKDATCTEDAYKVYECMHCGEEFKIFGEKAHHEYGDEPSYTEPATCDKFGYKIYVCRVCGVPDIVNYQDPLGHTAWDDALKAYVDANLKALLNATYSAYIGWYNYDVIFTLTDAEKLEGTVAVGRNGNNTTYNFAYSAEKGIALTLNGEAATDCVLTLIPAENGIGFSGMTIKYQNNPAAELEAGMTFAPVGTTTVKVEGTYDPYAWMQEQTENAGTYTIPETGTYVFDYDDSLFYLYYEDGYYPSSINPGEEYDFIKGDVLTFITEIADAEGNGVHDVTISVGTPSLEMPVCTLKQTLADCENPGSREYVCSVCNQVVTVIGKTAEQLAESGEKPTEIDAVGHAWRTVFVTEATCSTYTYFFRHCVNEQCSLESVGNHDIAEFEYTTYNFHHDPENPTKIMKQSEGGVRSKVERDENGNIKVTYGTALNPEKHTFDTATINEPTCTEPGDMVYHCTYCTKYVYEVLPALDHKPADPENEDEKDMIVRIETTCGRQGFVLTPCTREGCEVEYTAEQIKYLALAYSILYPDEEIPEFTTGVHFDIELLPAFEAKEHYAQAEAESKHSLVLSYSYNGVNYYEYEIIRSGGCEEVGLKKAYCTECKQYIFVVIDGTGEGHVKPTEEELKEQLKFDGTYGFYKDSTCTEWGRYDFYRCTACGEETDQWKAQEPTFKKPNYTEYTMTGSDKVLTTIDPDCPEAGEHTYTEWLSSPCRCSYLTIYHYDVKQIAPKNHMINATTSGIDKKTYKEVKPTCTEPGMTGAWYCSVCQMWSADEGATWVAEDPRTPIKATNHPNFSLVEREGSTEQNPDFCAIMADCEQFGYALFKCDDCDYYFIDDYQVAFGHEYDEKEDLINTEWKCDEGKVIYTYACKRNHNFTIEVAVEGHINKDGEVIDASCLFEGDRKCVNCKETVAVEHNMFIKHVPATCKEYGYDLAICADCHGNATVTNIDTSYLADHTWTHKVEKEATYLEPGLCKDECSVCHKKAEHVLPVLTGVEFIAKIDNAAVAGAGFADSSLVKITISLASATKAEVSSLGFDLKYDNTILNFVEAKFVSETFTTMCMANDNGTYVTVVANVPNNADKTAANTVIEAEQALVELYFRVNNATAKETTVSFDEIEIRNAEKNALLGSGADAKMVINKFMDFNADGDVNLADIMFAYDVMAGLAEATYDVTVDMDKDGDIDVEDITYLYEYYAGIKSYEDVIKLGVPQPETEPAA